MGNNLLFIAINLIMSIFFGCTNNPISGEFSGSGITDFDAVIVKGDEQLIKSISFELVGTVPRYLFGPDMPVLHSGKLSFLGEPIIIGYPPPELRKGPEGLFWLTSQSQVVILTEGGKGKVLPLNISDNIIALAPTMDGRVLTLLGDNQEEVLKCFSLEGEELWINSNLPAIPVHSGALFMSLLSDPSGDVLLYTQDGEEGSGMNIDLASGQLSTIFELSENLPLKQGKIWLYEKKVYWVTYRDENQYWHYLDLVSQEQHHITPESELQHPLGMACTPLENDGALLLSIMDNALVWMNSLGKEEFRYIYGGMVCMDDRLLVKSGKEGCEHLAWWEAGMREDINNESSIHEAMELIRTFITSVSLAEAIVEKEGSILIVGSDSEKVFVVRIRYQ